MSRRIGPGIFALSCCAAGLGGCSGLTGLTDPVATYGPANIMSPTGYAQSRIDDTHFKITATGTEATPKERVEKIARARAAQIGAQEKFKYFKVDGVQHGFDCSKRQEGYKSGDVPPTSRPKVVLDVVYAKEPTDPTFASSDDTYQALSAELASEVVAPEAKATAMQETRAGCGQG
jgi:hypothetical protein